jgi:micrococcal nuclease
MACEGDARRNRRGIWGHKFYAVCTPKSVRVRKIIYLNFCENWCDEFTITLNGRARRMFLKSELDLGTWARKSVRVRGWVKSRNSPMINASHRKQTEVLAR